MLTGTALRKNLNDSQALQGVDIAIAPGEATVVVGPNGAGKSVLIRALSLIDPPDMGVVTIDDRMFSFPATTGKHVAPPWPNVTVCFQQLFLWPHLTLRQSATLPLRHRPSADSTGSMSALAEELGIDHLLDRYPNECSLGERQRASLLRALLLRPTYLLCDEITAAMDVEAAYVVLEILSRELRRGMGLLMVTHQLGFAARVATTVAFLEGGQVKEKGGPSILSSPVSERMRRFVAIMES